MSEKSALRYRIELYIEKLGENLDIHTVKGSIMKGFIFDLNLILEETK